ncbi:MAG: aminotransferase class V-fold PLP-dependent enzyme [Kineosporiaceae bacterium]
MLTPAPAGPAPWGLAEFDALAPLALAQAREWAAEAGQSPARTPGGVTTGAPADAPGGADGVPAPRLPVGEGPREPGEVLADLRALVEGGLNTRSPRYLGYLPSGGQPVAALADLLAAAANPYTGLPSASPGGVAVDEAVVAWLCATVGLPAGAGGVLTSGGSLATLTGVLLAREVAGIHPAASAGLVTYVGEHRHHSVDAALRWAGLAEHPAGARTRVVDSDASHRMDAAALRRAMDDDVAAGLRPWLVVATAGTTSTGAVDPLAAVATHARAHGAWLHVDAAFGGMYALAADAPPALAGLGLADSVTVDPHKGLFLPYGLGALLVRERRHLAAVFALDAGYLPEDGPDTAAQTAQDTAAHAAPDGRGAPSPVAHLGLELTRPWRGLRAWLPLQLHGRRAFAAQVQARLALARRAHERLSGVPGLRVGPPPELTVVTFHLDDDASTAALLARLCDDGRTFLSSTVLGGRLVGRLATGSARTRRRDVEEVCDALARAAASVLAPAAVTPTALTPTAPTPTPVEPS